MRRLGEGRRGELLHNTKKHDTAQLAVAGCKCLWTDVICSSLSNPAHFDPELTHWDYSPLGSFLMRKLINRLNKVCFHEGIWGQIYLHHGECITASGSQWGVLTDSHCERPKDRGKKNRLIRRAWLDTRCFCRRFGKRFHLIRWNIKNKRLLSKCSWQPGMFAKAFRLNQSADAHHEADVSHFKLMVDKKRFAMSNCTHTLQPIMRSGNRRWIPFGRVTVSP